MSSAPTSGSRRCVTTRPRGAGCPSPCSGRLKLFDLDFEDPAKVDWTPVREAVGAWKRLHAVSARPLSYQDGGTFLRVIDRRGGSRILTLPATHRAVYLLCTEARRRDEVARLLPSLDRQEVLDVLDELTELSLMYREGERHLSLAIASRVEDAVRRIRGAAAAAAPAG